MERWIGSAAPAAVRTRSSFGTIAASMIIDDNGTVLGFAEGMEALTGWPGVSVVGLHKDRISGPRSLGTTARLYDGTIEIPRESATLLLRLHGRDGRAIDVEATARAVGVSPEVVEAFLGFINIFRRERRAQGLPIPD